MRDIVVDALPDSHLYRLPHLSPDPGTGITLYDRFRLKRRSVRGFVKVFGTPSEASVWNQIATGSKEGDIVSGHLRHGTPHLPGIHLKCITLLRNPTDRLVSEYNYHREGYLARSPMHKLYVNGLLKIAGTRSLSEYIAYLHQHKAAFGNKATSFIVGKNSTADPFDFMCQHYFHFGVLDEMKLYAEQLSEKLGKRVVSVWINKTRNPANHLLTDADQDKIQDLLGKDSKLYQQTLDHVRSGVR